MKKITSMVLFSTLIILGFLFILLKDPIKNVLAVTTSKPTFAELADKIQALEKLGLKPVAFYNKNDDIEILLAKGSISSAPARVIFNPNSNFQKITENLQVALQTEPLKTEFKTKYSSLLYIDLRVDNKVYYKFK